MAEYISMDCLWKCETCFYHRGGKCSTWCDAGEGYRPAYSALKSFAIEAEPVKHGRWEECDWVEYDGHGECIHYPNEGLVCTNCRNAFKKEFVQDRRVSRCPKCGAKMDVEG